MNPNQNGDKNPNWKGGRRINKAGYVDVRCPDHPRANPNGYIPEHILIAEKVLGRHITKFIKVHHVDEDRTNNKNSNLVICTESLHRLIHNRMRALKECGHARWIKCPYCQVYGDPIGMVRYDNHHNSRYHEKCRKQYRVEKLVYFEQYNKKRRGTGNGQVGGTVSG